MLERAIPEAALDRLSSVGWNGPTKEDVALGAQTGGPRCTGTGRDELSELLRRVRDVRSSRPGLALRAVLRECDEDSAGRFRALIETGVVGPSEQLLGRLRERGIARGEARPDASPTSSSTSSRRS
ncbi:TetR/AcrR family transcriptional regulator C-terminal ligand-binding domain-containing protein [Streptomyces sp. NPDC058052]|uniref:TetR/AcrR family transcriptional regulator C-terminal ligand-binding domain-containing protein n=1 Tax=Streptomyces sp. NPDC058052 TaxID=3346316 RepID=UPI0036F05725